VAERGHLIEAGPSGATYSAPCPGCPDCNPVPTEVEVRLLFLVCGLEAELEHLQTKSRRNAALIHWQQADRLQEILDGTYEIDAQ